MAGRPAREWTEQETETFKSLCGIFCTQAEICSILKCDKKTLHRMIADRLSSEIDGEPTFENAFATFSAGGRASLRRAQFKTALDGSVPMLIYLGKNYLGQSDNGLRDEQPKQQAPITAMDGFRKRSPVARKAAG